MSSENIEAKLHVEVDKLLLSMFWLFSVGTCSTLIRWVQAGSSEFCCFNAKRSTDTSGHSPLLEVHT
jgi:hypothetical protein